MVSFKCQRISIVVLVVLGGLFLVLSLAGRRPLTNLIDNQIKQTVMLRPGSDTFSKWVDPPISPRDDMYLFNITNPAEYSKGAKPHLEVVGPFVYKKVELKTDANVSGDGELVYYHDYEKYYFDENATRAIQNTTRLDDVIFIPNIPLISVATLLSQQSLPDIVKKLIEGFIETYEESHGVLTLTLNGSVHDILWGMPDPIMAKLHDLNLAPSSNFSLQSNGSTDPAALTAATTVHTGFADINDIGTYSRFHGRNSSGCWGTPEANVINGTDGTQFSPLRIYNKTQPVSIYNEQLYRSVDMEFVEETSYSGITCYSHRIPAWALQNVTFNPSNAGYYAYTYNGMLNLTKCSGGIPLFVTKPFFLDADSRLTANISLNVKPNKTLHDTYLCVEPYTGIVIDGHKRIQISVQTQAQNNNITGMLQYLRDAFVPIIYVDEHGSITRDLKSTLRSSLLIPVQVVHVLVYVVLAMATVMLLAALTLGVRVALLRYRAIPEREDDRRVIVREEEITSDSEQYLSIDGASKGKFYDAAD